ncbi:MAG: hypothetical protein HN368_18080 [Spirochaetales bacterium]|nr:hypothetical protein [Spirochaetales bacterium]
MSVDIPLAEHPVFTHSYTTVNLVNDPGDRRSFRAFGVDFSTDFRPITGSVNLLMEQVARGMQGRPQSKEIIDEEQARVLRWNLSDPRLNPLPKGYRYENRWALTVTTIANDINPVRGQRIYHWYGRFPRYPADDLIDEMAEYGCSIFILHMPVFTHITGSDPADANEMKRVVNRSHGLGMKVLFYCVPQLVSINAPYHDEYKGSRTENLRIWHSLKDTQIVFYEEDDNYDCDELCIRCPDAYEFIYQSVLKCFTTYDFDGIYVDFAWPVAGLCSDPTHDHQQGIFNFYDYWRMLRGWRKELGDSALMIGHGGGLLVSSDFVEGFDACLTGEAQRELNPREIGQQIGTAPTLWAMHRRKQEVFRSAWTIPQLVREGMTPHTGLGVLGTSVLASFDPAHHKELLPLWQMWRSFPIERARVYTYLHPGILEIDNREVWYTLFVTDDPYYLLILSNAGGPYHDANPAVSANVQLNTEVFGIPDELRCWRLKGPSYETFNIAEIDQVRNGFVSIPELLLFETIGFVLAPGEPPEDLIHLQQHLESRWDRLGELYRKKMVRAMQLDKKIDEWAKLPNSSNRLNYGEFIKDRLVE